MIKSNNLEESECTIHLLSEESQFEKPSDIINSWNGFESRSTMADVNDLSTMSGEEDSMHNTIWRPSSILKKCRSVGILPKKQVRFMIEDQVVQIEKSNDDQIGMWDHKKAKQMDSKKAVFIIVSMFLLYVGIFVWIHIKN